MFTVWSIIPNNTSKFTSFVHWRAEEINYFLIQLSESNREKLEQSHPVESHLDCELTDALSEALCCVSRSYGPLWQMHTDNTSHKVPSNESLPDSSRNFLHKRLLPHHVLNCSSETAEISPTNITDPPPKKSIITFPLWCAIDSCPAYYYSNMLMLIMLETRAPAWNF